ncbi:MAG: phosphoglycerate dehydrogenase [Armatimonadetes bacterium]|nr:phosphoglycerate dehydrogenase [Candidatus Hippobium faecium]
MPKVLVSDKLAQQGIDILKTVADVDVNTGLSEDELCGIIGQYDALVIRSGTQVTQKVLENAHNLKIIGRAGVGVDNVDVPFASSKGIIVCNSPSGNTLAACELTCGMILALARNIPQAYMSMKNEEWKRSLYAGVELNGKILAILGLGKIGREVAKRAKAFGMTVVAYDPFLPKEVAEGMGINLISMDEAIKQADFITLHLPKNKETLGIINKDKFAIMKDGVRIVNCARGGIINDEDLAAAIESGKVAGAAMDVFVTEPPAWDNPLFKMDKVIFTPHLGASTKEAQVNVAIDVCEQIRDVFMGGSARSAVNMPSMPEEVLEKVAPYIDLAKNMATFAVHYIGKPVDKVEIVYSGEISKYNTDYIKRSVITGILLPSVDEGVNMINCYDLAKGRGLEITETKSDEPIDYASLITLKVTADGIERKFKGTMLENHIPRIVSVSGYKVEFECRGNILTIKHKDVPGVIGQIGNVLGKNNINIGSMGDGRRGKGDEAFMLINIDSPATETTLKELQEIENLSSVRQIIFEK